MFDSWTVAIIAAIAAFVIGTLIGAVSGPLATAFMILFSFVLRKYHTQIDNLAHKTQNTMKNKTNSILTQFHNLTDPLILMGAK